MKLFHGSNAEIKEIKIQTANNGYCNCNLGFGIYAAQEQYAKNYVSDNGFLYELQTVLNKELSCKHKNFTEKEMDDIVNSMYNYLSYEDLYYLITDYVYEESMEQKIKKQHIKEFLQMEYESSNHNKDFFDGLFIKNNKILYVFEELGYTHTVNNPNGFIEYCLLPKSIVSFKKK